MNFRLLWIDRAIAALTSIYLLALNRGVGDAVVEAAARADVRLSKNPNDVGESRAAHERVMFESPLTVYFEVHEEEQVVVVTSVRYHLRG
jgi:hypothetical protein